MYIKYVINYLVKFNGCTIYTENDRYIFIDLEEQRYDRRSALSHNTV